ncbi:MAG: hypothetical protein HHJ11_15005 [Phycicoccus sp.]|nr:hypothetical protein [Phycicoccus sp.]
MERLDDEISDNVRNALARFLAVRACGHIEFLFDECLATYVESHSHPNVAAYVRSGLFTGRNPWPNDLARRMSRINILWSQELDELFDENDELLRREVSFLVDRRNKIAHGQNEGMQIRKSLDLADHALSIGDWISERLDPRH